MSRRTIDWTPEMDAILIRMREDRKTLENCAAVIGVSESAVFNRMTRLRMSPLKRRRNVGAMAVKSAGIPIVAADQGEEERDPLPFLHEITCSVLRPDPREYRGR